MSRLPSWLWPVPWLLAVSVLSCAWSPLFCAAAATNGYVTPWGGDVTGENTPPVTLGVASAVAAGYYHSLALRPNGTVAAWGNDSDGQADVPTGLAGVRAIAAGGYHSMALLSNGTVTVWGQFSGGQTNVPAGLSGVRAIAAGNYHCLALRSNGTVVAWGSPNLSTALVGVSAIASGSGHCLALLSNGMVYAWGNNSYHQCDVPNQSLLRAKAIAAGGYHSLVILSNGFVLGWGYNYYGQADGTGLSSVVGIAAGQYHSLALLANHRVVAWGDDSVGQTDKPSDLTNVVAVSTSWDRNLALRVLPVVITNQPVASQSVLAGTNVSFTVSVSGSLPIFFQWRKDGVPIADATNATCSLSNVQTTNSGVYSVAVTNLTAGLISSNSTLVVNLPPAITTQPVDVACADGTGPVYFSVTATGTAPLRYQWWRNGLNLGQEGANSTYTINNAMPSLAGAYTCVVTNPFGAATSQVATLTVYTAPSVTNQPQSLVVYERSPASFTVGASNATSYQWRFNDANIPGATNPTYSIASCQLGNAGRYNVLVSNPYRSALSSNAYLTVNALPVSTKSTLTLGESSYFNGSDYIDITTPPGLGDASSFALGMYHGLALVFTGSIIAWGDNSLGQSQPPPAAGVTRLAAGAFHSLALLTGGTVLGWGDDDAGQATPPPAATSVIAISAGGGHSLALRQDRTVVGWGHNSFGQAVPPSGINNNLAAISAGSEHSLALRTDGSVVAWGRYFENQTRVPPPLTNAATAAVAAIAAGGNHSMALRTNGTVVCWGSNTYGQTNVPPDLTGVIAIAAGTNHCLALKRDGTVVGWGADYLGQIDIPPYISGAVAIAAGGNRSLIVYTKQLTLLPPARRPAGGLTLYLANNDGSAADATTLAHLEVRATTNLALTLPNWTGYTNGFTLTNGLVRWDDTNATGLRWRSYRVIPR